MEDTLNRKHIISLKTKVSLYSQNCGRCTAIEICLQSFGCTYRGMRDALVEKYTKVYHKYVVSFTCI